jgi:glycosyltransferase involved in cell wall biosynthesis
MKIAILGSRGFPSTYGGYETLVRYLARRLVNDGHDVSVYCRSPSEGRRTWTVEGVRCIWTPGSDTTSASTLSFGVTSHLHAAAEGFDAALVLNIANGYFLPLLSARGVPTVLNTDGLEWERGKWGPAARKVFYQGARMSARHADILVSDSQAIADIWQRMFGIRPRFIPYGADTEPMLDDARVTALGLRSRNYALAVARLIPENNVALTLDALEQTVTHHPAVVVGSATYVSPLEARLRDLDHAGRIRWLGHVSDQALLTQLWSNCGVYVHAHSVGGTNPALLQALGAGAPTLALDTSFNHEVIGRKEQLFPQDASQLALRIDQVLSDDAIQREWAAHGRATVASRYTWQSVCDAYLEALRDAIETKAGGRRNARAIANRRATGGREALPRRASTSKSDGAVRLHLTARARLIPHASRGSSERRCPLGANLPEASEEM